MDSGTCRQYMEKRPKKYIILPLFYFYFINLFKYCNNKKNPDYFGWIYVKDLVKIDSVWKYTFFKNISTSLWFSNTGNPVFHSLIKGHLHMIEMFSCLEIKPLMAGIQVYLIGTRFLINTEDGTTMWCRNVGNKSKRSFPGHLTPAEQAT